MNDRNAIDLENEPALRELVDQIRREFESRYLKLDGRIVAVITPTLCCPDLTPEERRTAFLRSFGSWKGLVDTEALKKAIYESRGREYHPETDE